MVKFWAESNCYLCHPSVLPYKFCLGQYSETIHDRCFILSGQINLAWNLYNIWLFLPSDLICLENMTFTSNFCSGHYSETINSNCLIFSGHTNLPLDLCTAGLFWPFKLDITITLKILSDSLLGNYNWQLLHNFRAYQN